MAGRVFYLNPSNRVYVMKEIMTTVPDGWKVTCKPPKRTLEQNAKMWPMLNDLSEQVEWFGRKLTDEDWKDVMTASLKTEIDMVPTVDRKRFVILGLHTSDMEKAEFSELIEFMYAFGAEQGVVWSEPSKQAYAKYGRKEGGSDAV